MTTATFPADIGDATNARILAVSEDRIAGFLEDPFAEIARLSGVDLETVNERMRAMLERGTIRRVRQTLMATKLAPGALVAWRVPRTSSNAAFEYMVHDDPFSGHVVIRSTDAATPGSDYRLWTTLKVPQGFSLAKHCELLRRARRRRGVPRHAGEASVRARRRARAPQRDGAGLRGREEPARVHDTNIVTLTPREWRVLEPLKRELEPDEIGATPGGARRRSRRAIEEFLTVARGLDERGLIGRFSTFLEHVKPPSSGERVTRYNALFHWPVPPGREIEAGREVGRHHILTHAYWREGGPEFGNVNIMAVAHGMDKQLLLDAQARHRRAPRASGMPVSYTNVFWGGRSEIKPSEIAPGAYESWCRSMGVDPAAMRADAGEEQGAA